MSAMGSLFMEVKNAMELAANNLDKAQQSDDPELMLAVLVNVCAGLPSYRDVLAENMS